MMKKLLVFLLLALPAVAQINNGGGSGSSAFGSVTSGTNNSAAMVLGSGSSLISTGTGQLIGDSDWYNLANGVNYPFIPTYTVSNTGGSLTQGTYLFRLTYVGLATIVPSGETRIGLNATNCASNSTCQITVNMPTNCTAGNLPSGATGCTVWDGISGSILNNAEKQQAASSNCVNITTATCVVNTVAAGSTITFPTSSGIIPGSITSYPIPDGIIPTTYMQAGDGTFVAQGGVDYTALNVVTPYNAAGSNVNCPAVGCISGRYTWFGPWIFNDTNAVPIQANNQVSIHHLAGQTTGGVATSGQSGVDDRAFGVEMVDSTTANPFYEQSLSQYNERVIANNSITCSPINGGSATGESCAAAGRFILSDNRSAPTVSLGSPPTALAGVAASVTGNSSAFSSCGFPTTPCIAGLQAGAFEGGGNNQNGQNAYFVGGYFGTQGASGNSNGSSAGIVVQAPGVRFANNNFGLVLGNMGSSNSDWSLFVYGASANGNSHSYIGGPVLFSQPIFGSIVGQQIGTPSNQLSLTPTSCSGATTWQYQVVPKDMAGGFAPASTTAGGLLKTTTGCATLSGGAFLTIQAAGGGTTLATGESFGRYAFDIYRTTAGGTPSTTGYIGTVTCNFSAGCSFADTGLATAIPPNDDPTTPPAYNTSGRIAGYTLGDINTCQAVGTAASPSVASCSAASAGFVSCATNASGATCQVNTTAVTAHSQIEVHQREDTNAGTVLGVTCNVTQDSNSPSPPITAVSPGVSFTFKVGTITTNPECFSYTLRN